MKKTLLHVLLVFLSLSATAQQKYWVFFNDKAEGAAPAVSQATLDARKAMGLPLWQYSDLPVSRIYLARLAQLVPDRQVQTTSRWLNAVTIRLSPEELSRLSEVPFVQEIQPVYASLVPAEASAYISGSAYALSQVGAHSLAEQGLDGKGVTIGVIDAGFYKANRKKELAHLVDNGRIAAVKDYIKPENDRFYRMMLSGQDSHGTQVLENIAGLDKAGHRIGMAPGATFYLARTDHGGQERRVEEDYWIAALEWMDSLGVRIVNSSLGYADGFDDPAENHTPEQMDGRTVPVTLAAQIAATEKGMLIVASAGNEGDRSWRVLSAPADAPSVLAVGACGLEGDRMPFSSIGNEENGVKPEVCCFSNSGTSFSAPVITGLAACLMQYNDTLTGIEVKAIIEKSGHLYPYGNNYVGYGIPSAQRALHLAGGESPHAKKEVRVLSAAEQYEISPEWMGDDAVVVFHKYTAVQVATQATYRTAGDPLVLMRQEGIAYTTVVAGSRVLEIIW